MLREEAAWEILAGGFTEPGTMGQEGDLRGHFSNAMARTHDP